MIFNGASIRFSTEGDMQYETIGMFWDLCASVYGREALRGLGYNWSDNKIEYVIGLKNNELIDMETIRHTYPTAQYKEIFLPEKGWEHYEAYTKELDRLYGDIYRQGPLTYEIESFREDGTCRISVTRELPELDILVENDLEDVLSLYRQAVGRIGCVWDEKYPNEDILLSDIKEQCLYGIRNDEGRVIAAIARDRDDEIDALSCWTIAPAAELARLTVSSDYENQGLARVLIRQISRVLSEKGFEGVHYLVAENNIPAINSYKALNFDYVGDTDLFGNHFICYEKRI